MIKMYQYYSAGLQSNVTLSYNDGLLCAVTIEETKPIKDTKAYFFTNESQFVSVCNTHKIALTEIERHVSFEDFWEKYNYKASGRIPSQKAWEKLTQAEQLAAFDYIPAYESHLKLKQTAKKYGATYLNSKIYIK